MRRVFSKKLGKRTRVFGGLSQRGVPYAGAKHISKKGHTQSGTISPLRKTIYTKTNLGKFDLKTKTNIETGLTKLKIQKRKNHY